MAARRPDSPARERRLPVSGLAGTALTLGTAAALAAAGESLVPAAGWAADRGEEVPGWLLGPFGGGLGIGGGAFYALLWGCLAGWLLVLAAAPRMGWRWAWGLCLVAVGLLALAPPLLSQDVFSYIAYARMGASHGLDPYSAAPAAIAADPVFAYVGWPDATSVYGPVFTLASYALAPLSLAISLWSLKALAAASVLGAAALTARMAAWRGLNGSRAAAFVALNPLVLAHVVGGAHNDALMALGLTAGLALLLSAREATGGALTLLAAAVKLPALFAAPFALVASHRGPEHRPGIPRGPRMLAGMAVALAALAAGSLIVFGGSVAESLAAVDGNQEATSRYSVPATLARATGIEVDAVRLAALTGFLAAVAGLLAWTWRGGDWVRAAGWAGLALLLATGWLLPWYLVWILPAVAISRDGPLVAATVALTAFQLVNRVPL